MKKVWRVKRKGLFVTLLIVLFVALSLPVMVKAEGATVWTDKGDYAPGETVTIYGSGFNPEAQVTITVTRPDGTMDEWAITSNSSGALTTTYLLDGITGTYTVTATDGTNTVTTTFTDVPPTPTTSTISFSPSSPVTAGTTVTITGTVTVTSSGNPVTSGTIHIDEYKLGGVGVPYPTTGADWDTIDSGTPDTYGEFSTDFDTTGLGGKTIGFRSHYIPAGGTGYAESKSDPSNLVISAAFVSFKVSGHKTEYGGSGLSGWTIQLFKDTWVTPYATTTTSPLPSLEITEFMRTFSLAGPRLLLVPVTMSSLLQAVTLTLRIRTLLTLSG